MKNNYMRICAALKDAREKAGFTRARAAEAFGCGEELVEAWESGMREPTVSECLVLAGLYGVPLEELFTGVDAQAFIPKTRDGKTAQEL